MNNNDFISRHVADTAGVTPQQVNDSGQPALGATQIPQVEDEGTPFSPEPIAIEQGQKAIVSTVQAKEAKEAEVEQHTRMARAVAEAMSPTLEVGKINPEGKVVGVKMPDTMPEPRETIQAGIQNVGIGGRKGVYSELPFEAEDIPKGWSVIETEDGGYMAAPQEHTDEVLENERTGKRSQSLGYMDEKKETHDRVVQIRDVEGVAFHEETTDEMGLDSALTNALSISKQINGSVEVAGLGDVLRERAANYASQVSSEIYDAFATVEGVKPKSYKDSQELTTVGIGFNMEQKGARKMWQEAGVTKSFDDVLSGKTQLDDDDMKSLLGLTMQKSLTLAEHRATQLGLDWESLPEWHKAIVTDIAFNTGGVSGWKKVFTNTSPKSVLREARRLEGDKHTAGMDNRVARIGIMLGIIDTVSQAKELGLTLTDLKQSEVISLLKKRAKAQPTHKVAQMTQGVRG